MTSRALPLGGAALIIVGLFTPLVQLPMVGSVNLFGNGSNVLAWGLMVLALLAGWLAVRRRDADLLWPGIAAGGLVLFHFARLQLVIADLRESMKELEDNPFAGLAQAAMGTVQFQWGWLPLAAGAALLGYSGVIALRASGAMRPQLTDTISKSVAGLAAIILLLPIAMAFSGGVGAPKAAAVTDGFGPSASASATTPAPPKATAEEVTYMRDHLQIYDLKARYYDSMLDGRVPGVRFKIKNAGDRTLTKVTVRVVFQDKNGAAIAEEDFFPVLVSEYNFGDDNKPLRPNYIWQQEPDRFYAAKGVPSEWEPGKATATITEVEFEGAS